MNALKPQPTGHFYFRGDLIERVPNDDPALDVGKATTIYTDPVTRRTAEGVAIIREIERNDGPFMDARVEFVEEPRALYYRRIYRLGGPHA